MKRRTARSSSKILLMLVAISVVLVFGIPMSSSGTTNPGITSIGLTQAVAITATNGQQFNYDPASNSLVPASGGAAVPFSSVNVHTIAFSMSASPSYSGPATSTTITCTWSATTTSPGVLITYGGTSIPCATVSPSQVPSSGTTIAINSATIPSSTLQTGSTGTYILTMVGSSSVTYNFPTGAQTAKGTTTVSVMYTYSSTGVVTLGWISVVPSVT